MPTKRITTADELLTRGVAEVIDRASLARKLRVGRPLVVKLGIDPSGVDLHLGHAVVLWKLRQFQDLGHTIVLIIGDFTARIGDPSGRDETRKPLTAEEVRQNARDYLEQVSRILDVSRVKIRRQSDWYDVLSLEGFFDVVGKVTVPQLLAHETFRKRLKDGGTFGVHEFLYPILQAYDSFQIDADVELGGTDQKFNILTGRQLMAALGKPPQDVLLMRYLVGLDGKVKMGKSLGDYIALRDAPEDMYGKVMSLPDSAIVPYFELVTRVPMEVVRGIAADLEKGTNPRDAKARLAHAIVALYHSPAAAAKAEATFAKVFRNHKAPEQMPTVKVPKPAMNIVDLLMHARLASSKSEARRLVSQGAVRVDGKVVKKWDTVVVVQKGSVLQAGKRRFIRIV